MSNNDRKNNFNRDNNMQRPNQQPKRPSQNQKGRELGRQEWERHERGQK